MNHPLWNERPQRRKPDLRQRVVDAAEAVLQREGSVGPLELLQHLFFLQPAHFDAWRKGQPAYAVLEEHIQLGPEKFGKTIRYFHEWVHERGLQPIEASYKRRGPGGIEDLRITADGHPEREKLFRTHYAPAGLTPKKAEQLSNKVNKAPDLVVFIKVGDEGKCSECGAELAQGSFLLMEKGQPLCLTCGDLEQLVYLPAGDATLSRRSRKHSPLSAVVVKFSRARKRYERQGLLVTPAGLDRAEAECAADAPERAAARAQAAVVRKEEDREFVKAFTEAILAQFPQCPEEEAGRIAAHAGLRSSGRVGRSAAGQALDPRAVELAVIAHIRHEHTHYDELLMQGTERLTARDLVREKIERKLEAWRTA